MNKRKIGYDKESLVIRYLEDNGIAILERNYNTRYGEIDIIGKDGDYIVFFEVKYRSFEGYGSPLESVTPSKIKRIVRASRIYLYDNHINENSAFIRFDCVGVLEASIEWIKNAFQAY